MINHYPRSPSPLLPKIPPCFPSSPILHLLSSFLHSCHHRFALLLFLGRPFGLKTSRTPRGICSTIFPPFSIFLLLLLPVHSLMSLSPLYHRRGKKKKKDKMGHLRDRRTDGHTQAISLSSKHHCLGLIAHTGGNGDRKPHE